MGKTTDFEKERKKHIRLKRIKRLFAVLLITAAAVVLYAFRVDIAAQGLGVLISDAVSYIIDNQGYPVLTDSPPRQLASVGSRAVLLTESSMSAYNSAGNRVLEKRTAGTNTVVVTAGRYLLSYERGGFDIEIRTGGTVLYTHRFTEAIYCADIAENGAFAVSTGATGAQSQVECFDSNYSRQFMWLSTERIIHSLALDEKAACIAVGGVGLNEGVLDSALSVFELETGKERCSIGMEDEMLLALRLFEDGSAAAVTDKAVRAVSAGGKVKGEYFFDGEQLAAFDIGPDGGSVVATGDYDALHEQRIVRLDASAGRIASSRSASKAESVFVYGEDTLVFTGERVIRFDANMGRLASTETPEAVSVSPAGDHLYYATAGQLNRVEIK